MIGLIRMIRAQDPRAGRERWSEARRASDEKVVPNLGPVPLSAGVWGTCTAHGDPSMGFLNGRVTYTRYQVSGDNPLPFGEEVLEQVGLHAIGRHGAGDQADGVMTGWAAGDHVLDLDFSLEKNIINDAIHLAMRIDTDKIPSSLLNAYTRIETDARARTNPSGFPTKAQRRGQGSRQNPRRGRIRRRSLSTPRSLSGSLGWPLKHPLRRSIERGGSRPPLEPLPRNVRTLAHADHRGNPRELARTRRRCAGVQPGRVRG